MTAASVPPNNGLRAFHAQEEPPMIRYALAAALVALPIAVTAAQSDEGPPRWAANIVRKQFVIMHGVPAAYAAARDPSADNASKLRRGRMLFDAHCTACHGWTGQGSGPEAFALVPAPADLEWLARAPKNRSDPYMYWTIAEGGKNFESDMPAFKDRLSRKDMWAVIAYVRAGLPRNSP
jgi:mono/diheme cytochrome c family protein